LKYLILKGWSYNFGKIRQKDEKKRESWGKRTKPVMRGSTATVMTPFGKKRFLYRRNPKTEGTGDCSRSRSPLTQFARGEGRPNTGAERRR